MLCRIQQKKNEILRDSLGTPGRVVENMIEKERKKEMISCMWKISPKKTIDYEGKAKEKKNSRSEEEEGQKGKHSYITSITICLPRQRNLSKGTIKISIIELMKIIREGDANYEGRPKRPILGFRDNKKVGGISNEIFP